MNLVSAIDSLFDNDPGDGSSVLCVLDATGDTKSLWNKHNAEEVEAAKATFDALRKKGYAAFRVNKDGSKAEAMHTFDPEAEAVILVPPVVGG